MPADYDYGAVRAAITGSADWGLYPDSIVDRYRKALVKTSAAKATAGITGVTVYSTTTPGAFTAPTTTSDDVRQQLTYAWECEQGVYRTVPQMHQQFIADLDAINAYSPTTTTPEPTPAPVPSGAPTNLTAVANSDGSIFLNWNDVPGATSYRIYETASPNGIASVKTSESKRGPFTEYRTYSYWVTATVNGVESPASAKADATTTAPAAGTGGGGAPASALWQTTWNTNNVRDGSNLKDTTYNWQSTSPTITTSPTRANGRALKIAMPANGAQYPGPGAERGSGVQRCEMEPNVANFSNGSTGFFRFDVRLDGGFPINTNDWQLISQWKQEGTGSPPVELCVGNGKFYLVGHDSGGSVIWNRDIGPATTNVVHTLVIGLVFGTSSGSGQVNAWQNGVQKITAASLQCAHSGKSQYWKVGMYRNASITTAATVVFDRLAYGSSYNSVK